MQWIRKEGKEACKWFFQFLRILWLIGTFFFPQRGSRTSRNIKTPCWTTQDRCSNNSPILKVVYLHWWRMEKYTGGGKFENKEEKIVGAVVCGSWQRHSWRPLNSTSYVAVCWARRYLELTSAGDLARKRHHKSVPEIGDINWARIPWSGLIFKAWSGMVSVGKSSHNLFEPG